MERGLDGSSDLRGFRVDDDVAAEHHAADLPGVPRRVGTTVHRPGDKLDGHSSPGTCGVTNGPQGLF